MTAQIIVALLGIWLMSSPDILKYDEPAATNAHILGPIIATFAVVSWWEATRNVRLINLLTGFWLILSPFILSFNNEAATYNAVIIGILVSGLSLIKGKINHQFNGGWSSLFK